MPEPHLLHFMKLADLSAYMPINLLPLKSVLFPEGILQLTVVDPRYVDALKECQESQADLGIIAIKANNATAFERVGCEVKVLELTQVQPTLWRAKCLGLRRFKTKKLFQQKNGMWSAEVEWLADDDHSVSPGPAMVPTVKALAQAFLALRLEGKPIPAEPFAFERAGWVANRWSEILPVPLAAKQQLMALADPLSRLQVIDSYVRGQGIVKPTDV